MDFYNAIKVRRSNYSITDQSTISDERIEQILAEVITYAPSAFNSQSARIILLLNSSHKRLWEIVMDALRAIVPADQFAETEQKINSFAAGHGTILYFEDMDTVQGLQQQFPLYADNFPVWSMQSAGMLQYAVWAALSSEGLGASLQHYAPLIEETVRKEFGASESWKLLAQMPFGTPSQPPKQLTRMPIEQRLQVQKGAKS